MIVSMKSLWALPAVLRLTIAAQQSFSVHNDLLAFPQFDVIFSEAYITHKEARLRLDRQQTKQHDDRADATDLSRQSGSGNTNIDDDHGSNLESYEYMTLKGRPFLCTVPQVVPPMGNNNTAPETSKEERQQELMRASDHGWELLSGMKDCIYYHAGWWEYSFCNGEGVKQFHRLAPRGNIPIWPPIPDPSVHEFVLGRFSQPQKEEPRYVEGEAQKSMQDTAESPSTGLSVKLETRGESNYLVQRLTGGTECDLTGFERTITVQFHCNPASRDYIHMIKETATCTYLMVIHTPRLCNDVAFLPPQVDQPNLVTCQEIVSDDEIQAWKATKAAEVKETLFNAKEETENKPIMLGNIEVGGKKLVGDTPARTIEASKLVKPPSQLPVKEKYVATVAKSDGKYTSIMSESELKKYNIKGGPKDIARYVDELESWAGKGVPWKLNVVQTPTGMEFRGIRDTDEEDDEILEGSAEAEEGEQGSQEEYDN